VKLTRTQNFSRIREVYEAARKLAFRIRSVSEAPFRPDFLSCSDRRRLHRYLVEVHGWAEGLLEQMARRNALACGGHGEANPVEEERDEPDGKEST